MTDRIRQLEQVGFAAWPALEQEWLNGWLLRAAGGVTRRSNCASPVFAGADPLDDHVDRCEAWFEQRGLPPIFRLTAAADPAIDRRLGARGYRRDAGAVIMTRPIDPATAAARATVAVASSPSSAWLDLMAEEPGRGGRSRELLALMLSRIEGVAGFAGVPAGGRMLAIGLGVVAAGHVSLFMMRTREAARRTGLAAAVAGALLTWGAGRGATAGFLQVHPANAPAIALYHGLGFADEYEYWYRQPPGWERAGATPRGEKPG